MTDLRLILDGGAVVLPGPGFLMYGVWRLCQELRVKRWPRVPARIVESRIERRALRAGDEFVPVIFFEYTVNGVRYCTQADLFSAGTQAHAEYLTKRFHFHKSVFASVNPKRPSVASLESKTTIVPGLFIALGCLFTFVGIMFFRSL
jgi:hypothetical protein